MANRNLTPDELKCAHALLGNIREQLKLLAGDDPALLFAYRRKIVKELGYDERDKPGQRNLLKALKMGEQQGVCPECGQQLPERYAELDRKNAFDGYTAENTELIHAECHRSGKPPKAILDEPTRDALPPNARQTGVGVRTEIGTFIFSLPQVI